jgi:hypothetical protein
MGFNSGLKGLTTPSNATTIQHRWWENECGALVGWYWGNWSTQRNNMAQCRLSTYNPTCTALGLNPGHHSGRPEPTTWGVTQPTNTRRFTSWSFCTYDTMQLQSASRQLLWNSHHNLCHYMKTHTSISSVVMARHWNIYFPIIPRGKFDKLTQMCGLLATLTFCTHDLNCSWNIFISVQLNITIL